ncbi:hypothetical protein BWI97_07220 [Siphonobacter sp. BAB-5405]|uniref:hypothetical protein n=1 Tax=Siphonobacter sp. BAB-5405 TaxID=1864825 RepID=UPI000C803434|nr:hypothetical protein [Siphonobacter sp. BAB-5405]PMD97413.1 hypothetical protein BWI97_07220 [Siphonobacter sp. BAB-5405]
MFHLADIEMLPLEGGILRRLLVSKHRRHIDHEARTIVLEVAVLHYRKQTQVIEGVEITEEIPIAYFGKGDGLKRYRLETSDRKLVDPSTGLNVPGGTPGAIPEFAYFEGMLAFLTELDLVQRLLESNVERGQFDSSTYEVL